MTTTVRSVEDCPICLIASFLKKGPVPGRDADDIQCLRCGHFQIDLLAVAVIAAQWSAKRHLLSAATRAVSDRGGVVVVGADNIAELIAPFDRPQVVTDVLDRLMLLLEDRTPRLGESFGVLPDQDYPVLALHDGTEMQAYLEFAAELEWIVERQLTINGWRRIEELRSLRPKSRQAFVAMWFDSELDDAYTNGIDAALRDTKYYESVRVDRIQHNNHIDDVILSEIKRSGVLIADLTGNRAGVYFEAGFALGLGIPVLWTCRNDGLKDVHFDTRQFNFVVWHDSAELRQKLLHRISATVLPRA